MCAALPPRATADTTPAIPCKAHAGSPTLTPLFALLLAACTLHEIPHPSPLLARNQHPVQLTTPVAGPRPARAMPPGDWELAFASDWSNILTLPGPGADRASFDGEIWRNALRIRAGILAGVDLDVEVALLTTGGGQLDGFIEEVHDILGLANRKRHDQQSGRLEMLAERRDPATGSLRKAYELDGESLVLGDLPLTVSWFPFALGGFSAGIRGGVELPTGEEAKGYGSGGIDTMLGLVVGWSGPGVSVTAWGTRTWVDDPDLAQQAGLSYHDPFSAGASVELGVHEEFSILGQIGWEEAVLGNLEDEHASSDHLLLWVGARFQLLAAMDLELAMSQDLLRDVSPDLTLHAALRVRL